MEREDSSIGPKNISGIRAAGLFNSSSAKIQSHQTCPQSTPPRMRRPDWSPFCATMEWLTLRARPGHAMGKPGTALTPCKPQNLNNLDRKRTTRHDDQQKSRVIPPQGFFGSKGVRVPPILGACVTVSRRFLCEVDRKRCPVAGKLHGS